MLQIESHQVDGVLILDVIGRIASGEPQELFTGRVRSALHAGHRRLVVNLEDARTADASGVSALLGAYLDVREAGGDLRLANIRRFAELLILTPLYTSFDVSDSEEEALARFAPGAVVDTGTAARPMAAVAA